MQAGHGTTASLASIGVLLGAALWTAPRALEQPPSDPLPRWIAGCWSGTVRGTVVNERWTVADGTTLIGTSHTLKGQRVTEFEFLRVVVQAGVATYIAQPGGAPPTTFAATAQAASAITFENPSHDFPRRVGYQRLDATHLTAWIDGGPAAKGPRLDFPMTRVACDP